MIQRLEDIPAGTVISADVAIVGGGACGLTLARQLSGSGLRIVVLESGEAEETERHEALNTSVASEPIWNPEAADARDEFHSGLAKAWDGDRQVFGVRCRGLGGSTRAWAGKSAAFDPIDYQTRDWVAHSGWPLGYDELAPYVDRAAEILNLGPNTYGDDFWQLIGQSAPTPTIDKSAFSGFFWQFARGRVNPLDTMRFGDEYMANPPEDVRVLLNATVTNIRTDDSGSVFHGFEIASLDGTRIQLDARFGVLAAGAIENARLLLASQDVSEQGVGNENDLVGRFLSEHLMVPIGWFDASQAKAVSKRFGFYGLRHDGRSHMYAHGLQLSTDRQRQEELVNSAVFLLEERTPDDPFSAMARLVKRRSKSPLRDIGLILKNPVSIATGIGLRVLESDRMPDSIRSFITGQALRLFPNKAAREYRFRGLPHKLDGVRAFGICEQVPDPNNRVTLDAQTDALGQALPHIQWAASEQEQKTALRLGQLLADSFAQAGLPVPDAPEWLKEERLKDAPMIDCGHTIGTTRMSSDPLQGVVDPDCKLHAVDGLYAMGGSVMPTTGHANPTLMMLALTVRLGDHLKAQMASGETEEQAISSPLQASA